MKITMISLYETVERTLEEFFELNETVELWYKPVYRLMWRKGVTSFTIKRNGPYPITDTARCDLKSKEARKDLLLKDFFPFAQCYYSTHLFILQPFLPIY